MSRGRLKITLAAPSSAGPSAEDIFSSRWARLQSFLDAVFALSGLADGARAPSTFSYEELYGGVVDVCSQRQSAALYERLLGSLEARAGALLGGVRAELAPGSGALLLASLRGAWATFTSELTLVGAVFQHLDRSHVALLPGARSLWHVGVALWGAQLEGRRGALLARAVGALCEAVELERRGDAVDRGALAAVVRMLGAVDLMARLAVPPLLESTSAFYEAEGARLIGAGHVADFLLHVERRLREEVRAGGTRARARCPRTAPSPPSFPPPRSRPPPFSTSHRRTPTRTLFNANSTTATQPTWAARGRPAAAARAAPPPTARSFPRSCPAWRRRCWSATRPPLWRGALRACCRRAASRTSAACTCC